MHAGTKHALDFDAPRRSRRRSHHPHTSYTASTPDISGEVAECFELRNADAWRKCAVLAPFARICDDDEAIERIRKELTQPLDNDTSPLARVLIVTNAALYMPGRAWCPRPLYIPLQSNTAVDLDSTSALSTAYRHAITNSVVITLCAPDADAATGCVLPMLTHNDIIETVTIRARETSGASGLVAAMFRALADNTTLAGLVIDTDMCGSAVADFLATCRVPLRRLHLSHVRFTSKEDIDKAAAGIARHATLRDLSIGDVADVAGLCECITRHIASGPRNEALRALHICDVSIAHRTADAIAALAAVIPRLEYLRLARCSVSSQWRAIILNVLHSKEHLNQLTVDQCEVYSNVADIVGLIEANKSLRKVDLSGNYIDDDGAIKLAAALDAAPALGQFLLDNNRIKDEGARALCKVLVCGGPRMQTHLDMRECPLSAKEMGAIRCHNGAMLRVMRRPHTIIYGDGAPLQKGLFCY